MSRREIVPLEIGKPDEMSVAVAGLAVAVWRETLSQSGSCFDQDTLADWCGQKRFDNWEVSGVASAGGGNESNPTGEERRLLRGAIPQRTKCGQSENLDLD